MTGFRAKDADRDRFVELIESAYVDGQISSADRDLRVGRALTAETLEELQSLTRDLQLPPGAAPIAAQPSTTPEPAETRWSIPLLAQRMIRSYLLVSFIGVVIFLAAVSTTMFAALGGSESDFASDSGPVLESELADPEVMVEEPTFTMTARQVRAFLDAYEDQFGTLEAYEASFYPSRVGVQVPVRGSRPRMERWSWTGEWRQDTEASRVTGTDGTVDLGTVDVRRMFANIDVARKTLNVERGRLTHVLVNRWFDDLPSVNIYVGNQFDESGYLKTTPGGELVRAFPYDG